MTLAARKVHLQQQMPSSTTKVSFGSASSEDATICIPDTDDEEPLDGPRKAGMKVAVDLTREGLLLVHMPCQH